MTKITVFALSVATLALLASTQAMAFGRHFVPRGMAQVSSGPRLNTNVFRQTVPRWLPPSPCRRGIAMRCR